MYILFLKELLLLVFELESKLNDKDNLLNEYSKRKWEYEQEACLKIKDANQKYNDLSNELK